MARIGSSSGEHPPVTIGTADGLSITQDQVLSLQLANATQPGALSANDWNIFNNKLDASRGNYITNPGAEVDTSGWNLYNNAGRTNAAYAVINDITYTSVVGGDAGNGININYIFHPTQPSSTPLVTVVSSTQITVAWYNGPTLANNPTATQLKAAYDAVPGAVAIATSAITGIASNLQYITGSHLLANGGDTSPVNGTGGIVSPGVTFIRSTISPLQGTASFHLIKDAANHEGTGVSTDFQIAALDEGNTLQISFSYFASSGMILGINSDVKVFIYDVTNGALIPVIPHSYLNTPVSAIKTYTGTFVTSPTSVNYRLILHISTPSATAWDLELDNFIVSSVLNPTAATQVPSVVLQNQPISGSVTDHMAVAWADGATQWVPATSSYNGDYWSMLGFATNIVGSTADIFVHGFMDGFSFGPFVGYNQYVDPAIPGGITPLPSPFTDTYVIMGKSISATALNIQVFKSLDLITSKGGLLGNKGLNIGNGDEVLPVGANGNVLVANSAAAFGFNWAPAVVAGTGLTYTTSTRALALSNLAGDVTGAPGANTISAATVTGKLITGYVSGAGTVAATDTILQAIDKLNGNTLLKAPIASPTFTGTVTGTFSGNITGNVTGNASGSAASFTGSLAGDVSGTQGATVIGANVVTNAKLAQMPAHTFKGNNTGSTANALDLTANQLSAELNSSIVNSSVVTGATVTDALNTLSNTISEVYLKAIKNAGVVTANTEIPTWTTVVKDTNSAFNSSTGTFTVPVAGDYEVFFTAATTAGTPLAQVYYNGALIQTGVGSGVRTDVTATISNAVVNDTIWVALDSSLTLTSTATDTILNISKISGASASIVNARYHASATVISAALATITYTTKDFDTQAAAYASGVYTIPSAGKYIVKASLALTAATAAAGNNYDIIIRKNSVEISRNKFVVGAATQKPNTVVVEDLVSCALNDTIDIQASAAGTTPSISGSNTLNYFFINKVSI